MKRKPTQRRRSNRKARPASRQAGKVSAHKRGRTHKRRSANHQKDFKLARKAVASFVRRILPKEAMRKLILPDDVVEQGLGLARSLASRWRHPDAEDAVMGGFYKAVDSFDPFEAIVNSFQSWVEQKVDYELRNLWALHNRKKVRDAFIEFRGRFGYDPTVEELARFARISPRIILNVLQEIASELGLHPSNNSLLTSLLDLMDVIPANGPPSNSVDVDLVNKALKQMKPSDACLLVLKYLCGYSEKEILKMIRQLRQLHKRKGGADAVEALLDSFVQQRDSYIAAPWDIDLFQIKNRAALALRLFRARVRFRDLLT